LAGFAPGAAPTWHAADNEGKRTMSSTDLHEDPRQLKGTTKDMHRAISSLREELEAVDWYQQRVDACEDPELAKILAHNMEEEIEHAAMVLEWLRRNHTGFAENLETYLFTKAPICEVEEEETGGGSDDPAQPQPAPGLSTTRRRTIGSLAKPSKGDV
jgi:ferritin-like protein